MDGDWVRSTAQQGVRGAGGQLPHLEAIQHSFGPAFDVSDVEAHVGGQAASASRTLHARAYTVGNRIGFRSSPDLHLAAHEAAHVVQQRAGVTLPGGLGQAGDAHEQHAEAVADRVVAGESASDLLGRYAGGGGGSSPGVQRYIEEKDTDKDLWRVGESGKSALLITQEEGGQQLFATTDLVKAANQGLKKAGQNGSFVRLEATNDVLKQGLLPSVKGQLNAVVPKLVSPGFDSGKAKLEAINLGQQADDDGKTSPKFALWADCGRSSRAVMGTDDTGGAPKARYSYGGKNYKSKASSDPAEYTSMYKRAMPEFMKVEANKKFLTKGVHYHNEWENVSWKVWEINVRKVMVDPRDVDHAKEMYWKLGDKGRRAFDEYAGINTAADPTIGGAYTMATEYDMPGFKEKSDKTWNFHWAGVVMKDGSNNITLENYAVSYGTSDDPQEAARLAQMAYDEVNRSWVFQMYGTAKKGQSFHEQHLESGTHGNRGSTFAVRG